MKPLLVSSGEPAGIGPDLCLALAAYDFPLVVLGDLDLLKARAKELNLSIHFVNYDPNQAMTCQPGHLTILTIPCRQQVKTRQLDTKNAPYVIELLSESARLCGLGEFSALITAPVHKAIINEAGIPFTGHTEFFSNYFGIDRVVMMLASQEMKVALVTTHLPLSQVPSALSIPLIVEIILKLNQSLIDDFGIIKPKIKVAGLNPHAGESGYLGHEEIEIINPALEILSQNGVYVEGPLPADTLFTKKDCDVYVAMYHDQGLPVLKYAGFNHAVNITLGLPIIRTSVDHGTALDLAGFGTADPGSMLAAVRMAIDMVSHRIS